MPTPAASKASPTLRSIAAESAMRSRLVSHARLMAAKARLAPGQGTVEPVFPAVSEDLSAERHGLARPRGVVRSVADRARDLELQPLLTLEPLLGLPREPERDRAPAGAQPDPARGDLQ